MYLPEEVILRVNKIEGDTVFMGPKYRCLRFLWSDNNDYEFKYALADEIDEIIKLKINDTHIMSFNRDDDRHKGVVVRVS